VAREAVRRRAPSRPVPHVHAVQGHERGLARPAGDALLQARDRSSPPQTETAAAELKPQEVMRTSRWWNYDCSDQTTSDYEGMCRHLRKQELD